MLLCSASLCSGQNATDDNVKASKGELQSSSSTSTTAKPPTSSTSPLPKAKAKQAHEIEEDDKNFSNDRLPELTDAEYSSLGEDANPLHFLKQQQPQPTNPQPKPEPMAMPQPSASSIYITIPIYINAAGKLPLTLAIGDQQMSLNQLRKSASANKKSPHTKSPNSHFNRLLQQIETTPKRRVTNRHRSQLKSNIRAAKERPNRHAAIY
ncbi:uncharacterized protein LOC117893312 [Drosophila subobscura]|uniref:uncharacterized protein LOC117893312 n=1 Tax=Drosophila subobscura TaxID=7241 RepID=UPI00155AE9AB|nr:uncharacterized protein LOC117893312 [Drosophila subobscura]